MPPKPRNLRAVTGQKSAPRSTAAEAVLKGDEIFRLVAKGYTVTEAGQAMDPPLSKQRASTLYNEGLARVLESDTSLRQAILERELETLRLLKKAWMPRALTHDFQAARVVLQVVDRVSDLAGLNQSLKIQISNQRVDATVSDLVGLVDNHEDQVPRLLESGVLVIGTHETDDETNDETAAG